MEKLYDCLEVAKMYKVKISTVYRWIKEGKLKAIKIGKMYRFREEHLAAFMEALDRGEV